MDFSVQVEKKAKQREKEKERKKAAAEKKAKAAEGAQAAAEAEVTTAAAEAAALAARYALVCCHHTVSNTCDSLNGFVQCTCPTCSPGFCHATAPLCQIQKYCCIETVSSACSLQCPHSSLIKTYAKLTTGKKSVLSLCCSLKLF